MEIRAWRDDDVDWWLPLRQELTPDRDEELLRRMAAGQVYPLVYREVALWHEQPVGFGWLGRPSFLPCPVLAIQVQSSRQGHGIGSALFRRALKAANGSTLFTQVWDDDERSLAVVQHWGFAITSHGIESRLMLPAPTQTARIPEGYGLRVIEAEHLGADDEARINQLLAESATHPEAQQDAWSTTVEGLNSMFPGVIWIVAEAGNDVVAVTTLAPQHAGDWVLFYTGVAPAHRGRGLARAVKQLLHQVAAERGAPAVTTTNEISNISIRRLNQSLGYQRVRGEIRLRRSGDTAEP